MGKKLHVGKPPPPPRALFRRSELVSVLVSFGASAFSPRRDQFLQSSQAMRRGEVSVARRHCRRLVSHQPCFNGLLGAFRADQ